MKRDGHTHTHFCRHGSGEDTEAFISRAIELGFTTYSLTEHMPYPEEFLQKMPYSQECLDSLRILGNDFDAYIREMEIIKKKYRDKIHLLIGSEIDFLPEQQDYTRYMLKEYGPYLEDGLLSVHVLKGIKGWHSVDYCPEDLKAGVIEYYLGYEQYQLAYYRAVKEALVADLGPYKPKRISHLTLCNKFQHCFIKDGIVTEAVQKAVGDILDYMKRHGYSLDVNAAGLYKEYCCEIYPSPWIIEQARRLRIEMVYGSDSHAVADVGRGYDVYEQLCCK